jgi:hypothetical protein
MTRVIEWEFSLSGQKKKIHGKLLRIYERIGPDSRILQTKNPPQKIEGQQRGGDGWGRGGGGPILEHFKKIKIFLKMFWGTSQCPKGTGTH